MIDKLQNNIIMHNKYMVEVVDTITGKKREHTAYNIACNGWKEMVMNSRGGSSASGRPLCVFFGDGIIEPQVTDTTLTNSFGYKEIYNNTMIALNYDDTTNIQQIEGTITLSTTEFVGKTFTEIGFGGGTSPTYLYSHALFTDSEGNPMPVGTKTDTEIYNIKIICYMQMPVLPASWNVGYSNDTEYGVLSCLEILRYGYARQDSYNLSWYRANIANTYKNVTLDSSREYWLLQTERFYKDEANGVFGITSIPYLYLENLGLQQRFPSDRLAPYTFNNTQIGTGDGVNEYFHLASSFFDEGTLSVVVNDIATSYEITNRCSNFILNHTDINEHYGRECKIYASLDDWSLGENNLTNYYYYRGNNDYGEFVYNTKVYYTIDLGEILRITHYYESAMSELQYSNDGINWIQIVGADIEEANEIGSNYYKLTNPTNFRYFRFDCYNRKANIRLYCLDTIKITPAPAEGAVVKATWTTSIPPKNINFEYEFSYKFEY